MLSSTIGISAHNPNRRAMRTIAPTSASRTQNPNISVGVIHGADTSPGRAGNIKRRNPETLKVISV